MQIFECKDENAWVETVNQWLAAAMERYEATRVFLPAGETPRPLYKSWQTNGTGLSRPATFVQLDDILVPERPFRQFFIENLPRYQNEIEFIDAAESGAELALLGLGLNGHIAFHEPGISDHFYSGCLELSVETAKRLKLPEHARGVSYGLKAFMQTRAIALLVRGENKRSILRHVMNPECKLPAAKVLRHRQAALITDFKI